MIFKLKFVVLGSPRGILKLNFYFYDEFMIIISKITLKKYRVIPKKHPHRFQNASKFTQKLFLATPKSEINVSIFSVNHVKYFNISIS